MVKNLNQADIYLPEVNNRNARKMYKICSKLAIKTCGVFIVNFKQISNIFLMFPSLTLHKKTAGVQSLYSPQNALVRLRSC